MDWEVLLRHPVFIIRQQAYTPDLASLDYHLFRKNYTQVKCIQKAPLFVVLFKIRKLLQGGNIITARKMGNGYTK